MSHKNNLIFFTIIVAFLGLGFAGATTYEVVDDTTTPPQEYCGNGICASSESCSTCASDCGTCQIGDDGGDDGGGGGGGGSSGTGSEGYKALTRDFMVSPLQALTPADISLVVTHAIPSVLNFVVEVKIYDGSLKIYEDSYTISGLASGNVRKVTFSKKWIPQKEDQFYAKVTLYSGEMAVKYDEHGHAVKIGPGAAVIEVPKTSDIAVESGAHEVVVQGTQTQQGVLSEIPVVKDIRQGDEIGVAIAGLLGLVVIGIGIKALFYLGEMK